jgi:hypothetical protein
MRNKFTTAPRVQTPPAVCKKVPKVKTPFNPCPTIWPPTTQWVITPDLFFFGGHLTDIANVTAPDAGGQHWIGQANQVVTVGIFTMDMLSDVSYNLDPLNCTFTLLVVLTGFIGGFQMFQYNVNQPGLYNEGLPFVFHTRPLQAFPADGIITVAGS